MRMRNFWIWVRLRICAFSPDPLQLASTQYGTRRAVSAIVSCHRSYVLDKLWYDNQGVSNNNSTYFYFKLYRSYISIERTVYCIFLTFRPLQNTLSPFTSNSCSTKISDSTQYKIIQVRQNCPCRTILSCQTMQAIHIYARHRYQNGMT